MRKLMTAALVLGLGMFAGTQSMHAQQANQQKASVQITQQPHVESASQNSAQIAWSTNVSAGSVVKYGTDPNNLTQQATAPWGGTTHRVELKNLQPGTTYYFQAMSAHASGTGTEAMSGVQQFRTAGSGQQATFGNQNQQPYGQQQAPYGQQQTQTPSGAQVSPNAQGRMDNVVILAGPVVQSLSGNAATLWWQTDDMAATHVKYGNDPNNLTQSAYEPGGQRDHRVQLTSLQPGQTVYYEIMRRDGSVRTRGQFATPQMGQYGMTAAQGQQQQGLITNGPILEYISQNNAVVSWSTSVPASSVVRFGTDPNNLTQTAQAPWGSTTHRVQLNNLQPNTQYYFEVSSSQSQGAGAMAMSYPGQFRTVAQGQQALSIRH